ncbi:MAG: sugar phosphate isomerase/epimerase, partial [Oscillospiraceae bacterium]|nr:sugar phosphate isomerase/epimerase [Oscillospiraceae bacterium]
GVVFALEPNPEIYSTDFLNTTDEALDFCRLVDCEGLKVNLDFGTVIANEESVVFSNKDISYINHVHLSEPYLVPIKKRETHRGLREALEHGGYNSYISVEMGKSERDDDIIEAALYLKEVFG